MGGNESTVKLTVASCYFYTEVTHFLPKGWKKLLKENIKFKMVERYFFFEIPNPIQPPAKLFLGIFTRKWNLIFEKFTMIYFGNKDKQFLKIKSLKKNLRTLENLSPWD